MAKRMIYVPDDSDLFERIQAETDRLSAESGEAVSSSGWIRETLEKRLGRVERAREAGRDPALVH